MTVLARIVSVPMKDGSSVLQWVGGTYAEVTDGLLRYMAPSPRFDGQPFDFGPFKVRWVSDKPDHHIGLVHLLKRVG